MKCFFVSDLHGNKSSYEKLCDIVLKTNPQAVFLGGDLAPSYISENSQEIFLNVYFRGILERIKAGNSKAGTEVFVILGNDDIATCEEILIDLASAGLCKYIHNKKTSFHRHNIYGYSFVPPTPFMLKDWEKYDVSRYVDPGCISPEEGYRTVFVEPNEIKYATIQKDLIELKGEDDLHNSIFLFHSPPYETNLDRISNDGKHHEHAPLDLHAGSIAIRRFIEDYQPGITLHGHIHESARLSGSWKDRIGETFCFSAAHDGEQLCLVELDSSHPEESQRIFL